MPLGLFTERNSSAGYTTLFLGSMTMMGVFFFLTQFLQEVIRLDALTTGFAFLPIAAMLFVASRLVPPLIAKSGPKPVITVGLLLMIAGLLWLTRVSTSSTYLTSLLGPMLLYGFGAGMAFTPLNIVIMSTAPPKYAGAASGVLQTMQQLGSTLGLAVLATIFGSAASGAAGSDGSAADQLVSGMRTAFFGATAIAIVTLVIALSFRRMEPSASLTD
jgi:predicted MFS family arabinose efflux permease